MYWKVNGEFYVVFAAIFLGILEKGYASKITQKIDTESQPAGSTGMLNCTVLSRSRAQLIWQKLVTVNEVTTPVMISIDQLIVKRNRQLDNGKMKFEILVTQSVQKGWTFTLMIRSLTSEDAGDYKCVLMLDGKDHTSYPYQIGQLVVQTPPDLDTSSSTIQVDAIEGRDAILLCKATGNPEPKISWSRPNGAPLPGGQLTVYGEQLVLKSVNDAVAGLYRCKADNNVRPPGWLDIPVRIFHAPKITPFRKTVGQAPDKNNEVGLSCFVRANPKPEMSWWNADSQQILDDYKHEIQTFDLHAGIDADVGNFMTTMLINNVQAGDYGNYTCMAENIYGKEGKSVKLFYTPTCQGAKCLFESRILSTGRENRASCPVVLLLTAVVFIIQVN